MYRITYKNRHGKWTVQSFDSLDAASEHVAYLLDTLNVDYFDLTFMKD